jgi:hypothetical protein
VSELLYDSVDPFGIPANAPAVAGYGDGNYVWPQAGWDRFPNARKLSIVVSAAHQGDVLDVEKGDALPGEVPGWCDRFNRPGRRRPTIYCNRGSWPAVRAAVGSNRQVDYWISTLDGTTQVPGAVAVQYVDVGPYDLSVILDPTWIGGTMSDQQIQSDVRSVLDEGTAPGQTSWASTVQATLETIQQNYNLEEAAIADIKSLVLGATGVTPGQLGGALRAAAHVLDGL